MEQIYIYVFMFGMIVLVGQYFRNSSIPIGLIFVFTGILLSFIPYLPAISLHPDIVLNFFLPLLVYEISSFTSWREIKKNLRPITLLSVGHVIFITVIVAVSIHALIPQMGWPLAFALGAIVSPPDDVAVVSIAETMPLPERIFTILEGEAMFNDAAALTLFRFAIAALITNQFSAIQATSIFLGDVAGETLYGFLIGNILGSLRKKLTNPAIHIIASVLTPFLAYLPVVQLGGSGIIATAITGFIIGNQYAISFTPEYRLISRAIWPAFAFAIQSLLFLLVGFNIRTIFENISSISVRTLTIYTLVVIAVVVVGRFIWQYLVVGYIPRILLPSLRRRDPYPPWQYLFIISWAGMRGGISLAAALSIPFLPVMINGVNARELIIFLVTCVIIATLLLQGLSLPWLIKLLGIHDHGLREKYNEHLAELSARIQMTKSALRWLIKYKAAIKNNEDLLHEIKTYIRHYRMLLNQLKKRVSKHDKELLDHDETEEIRDELYLLTQLIEIERLELLRLWQIEKINLSTRNKLLSRLDHRIQHLIGS